MFRHMFPSNFVHEMVTDYTHYDGGVQADHMEKIQWPCGCEMYLRHGDVWTSENWTFVDCDFHAEACEAIEPAMTYDSQWSGGNDPRGYNRFERIFKFASPNCMISKEEKAWLDDWIENHFAIGQTGLRSERLTKTKGCITYKYWHIIDSSD